MIEELLDKVIQDWSDGAFHLKDRIDYFKSDYKHFSLDGVNQTEVEKLKDKYEYSPTISLDVEGAKNGASYYKKVQVSIVGANLMFGNDRKFELEGIGWGIAEKVDDCLKGFKMTDYQKEVNDEFNSFFKDLKAAKEESL